MSSIDPDRDVWQEQLRRGGLELAVLLTLATQRRYGLEIIRHLEESTDLVLTEGTVYPLLARLTQDGLLTAEWDTSEARPRKYYRLTPQGRAALRANAVTWAEFAKAVGRVMSAAQAPARS